MDENDYLLRVGARPYYKFTITDVPEVLTDEEIVQDEEYPEYNCDFVLDEDEFEGGGT